MVVYWDESLVKLAFIVKVVVSNLVFSIHYAQVVANVLDGGSDVDQNLFMLIVQPLGYVNLPLVAIVEILVASVVHEKLAEGLSYGKVEQVSYASVAKKVVLHVVFCEPSKETVKHQLYVTHEDLPITTKNVRVEV